MFGNYLYQFVWRQMGSCVLCALALLTHFFNVPIPAIIDLEKGEMIMNRYKEMYLILFNAITDAIEILQKAQKKTEEIYMKMENPLRDKRGLKETIHRI